MVDFVFQIVRRVDNRSQIKNLSTTLSREPLMRMRGGVDVPSDITTFFKLMVILKLLQALARLKLLQALAQLLQVHLRVSN